MSLFLASIGLALVLRQAIFLVAGPQPRSYDVDPYKVYVLGEVRLAGSQAVGDRRRSRRDRPGGAHAQRQLGRPQDARRRRRPRARRGGGDRLEPRRRADVDRLRRCSQASRACSRRSCRAASTRTSASRCCCRSSPRSCWAASAARTARSLGGLLLGLATELSTWPGFHGGVNPVYKPVVAFVVLIGVLLVRPQGLLGKGADAVSTIASGEFWAFVGVVAGIYTLLGLGIQLEFGFAGLLNFGHVAFMAIGAYTMAILVVKAGWSMWLAAPLAILAAAGAGVVLGLPTLRLRADYFAIATIAFAEIVRYVATNEDRLTGGSQGTINLAGADRQRPTTGSGSASRAGCRRRSTSARRTSRCSSSSGSSRSRAAPASGRQADRRGAASCGRSGRTRTPLPRWGRTSSPSSCRRSRSASALAGLAGCFYAWQFSFFSPDDFAPAAHVLRLDDRHPRRARAFLGRAGRGASSSACSSPAPASSTSRRSRGSTPPSVPTCG